MGNNPTQENTMEETKHDDVECFQPDDAKIAQPNPDKKCSAAAKSLYQYRCPYSVNKDGSVTFYPSPHLNQKMNSTSLAKTSFLKSSKFSAILQKLDLKEMEAISDWDLEICGDDDSTNISPFITAAVKAFNEHYPFRISPNNVLLLVLQGIAVHVDANSEKLRSKYVKHEEKIKLTVERDSRDFVLRTQSRDNDWGSVIREFVQQIDKFTVDDTVELMDADFSDSSLIDQVSAKISVMDICKNYFEYEMICVPGCGFPQITLTGTKADWVALKSKIERLLTEKVSKKFGSQWMDAILPLMDRFIGAFDGAVDCLFWNSMIKSGVTERELASSGGPMYERTYWFSGWFNILFPFCCSDAGEFYANKFCRPYSMDEEYVQGGVKDAGVGGNDVRVYPLGLSSAPVKTLYIDAATRKRYDYQMKFVSGLIGYTQNEKTKEIGLQTGWIITYDE
mmetsp:Transcript_32278/g.52231  ORF Transcript_32278/g.52231 Transcript_32278/m.52231 type:complete len:451 (+) Transcript_32278:139-1491(+)